MNFYDGIYMFHENADKKDDSVIVKPSYEYQVNDFWLIMDFIIIMKRLCFVYDIGHELHHIHSQHRTRIRSYT